MRRLPWIGSWVVLGLAFLGLRDLATGCFQSGQTLAGIVLGVACTAVMVFWSVVALFIASGEE
jgi:hypothetical protein